MPDRARNLTRRTTALIRSDVHVEDSWRRIAYKETIRKLVQVRGRHKKQSGGHGQFGDVALDVRPQERGAGFAFAETVHGGTVPKQSNRRGFSEEVPPFASPGCSLGRI